MLPETKRAIDALEDAMAGGYLHPAVNKEVGYIKELIFVAKYFTPDAASTAELRAILAALATPAPPEAAEAVALADDALIAIGEEVAQVYENAGAAPRWAVMREVGRRAAKAAARLAATPAAGDAVVAVQPRWVPTAERRPTTAKIVEVAFTDPGEPAKMHWNRAQWNGKQWISCHQSWGQDMDYYAVHYWLEEPQVLPAPELDTLAIPQLCAA